MSDDATTAKINGERATTASTPAGDASVPTRKARVATAWLDGCSGCHMSLLDIDERLLLLAPRIDLVYGPLVDAKEFPEDVDVALVEGAVATDEDLARVKRIRERTRVLVALGDCCVTGNVPAMRNAFAVQDVLNRAYVATAQTNPAPPTTDLPRLLDRVRPVHEVVRVDVFIPGCPPPADAIFAAIAELLENRMPDVSKLTRFGR